VRTRAGHVGIRRLVATFATVAALGATAVAIPATPAAADGGRHGRGPYAVGSRSFTFVDTSRPTPANGTYPGAPSRTLPTLVLYPASGPAGGPVTPGARPAHAEHGFPLIVFSHGFTASGPVYQGLLALLARAGYVVAAPTFPLSNLNAPGGPTIVDYLHQPGDVSFVISRMLDLDRHDADGLRHAIDRHHVGVAGHSLGAITTLLVATNTCCQDHRIDAAVAFSGLELGVRGGVFFGKPTPPLMLVHGDADRTVPYGGSVSTYAQSPAPKAFLTLVGAPHTPFVAPWLGPTVTAVVDFFDGFLRHDHEALERLRRDGNVPGVATVQADLDGHRRRHAA
jgi:dienelactone hydrolase